MATRLNVYYKQNGGMTLTARQRRRIMKKEGNRISRLMKDQKSKES